MWPAAACSTTMSERRSVIVPPEMTKGSTSGRVSSKSSARAIRIGQEVEEMQLATTARELAGGLTLEHHGNEPVTRVEDQRVQGTLRTRAISRGILLVWELEERVQLDGRAATECVVDDHPAGVDVAGAAERSDGVTVGRSVQNAQVSLAQLWSSVGNAFLRIEEPIEHDERVGFARGIHHLALKVVIEAGVHQLHRQAHIGVGANALRDLAQPAQDLRLLLRECVARERR